MQLSPRPDRISLTCPCGARLSVIPRLQETEIKCPRCQKALMVQGDPVATSTVFPAAAADLPASAELPLHHVVETSNYESAVLPTQANAVPPEVAAGHGASHMNTFLSETVPKSVRTLMDLSGYQNAANHIQQLRTEGKVRAIAMQGGGVGYIIDPDWLKTLKDYRASIPTPIAEPLHSEPATTSDIFVASDSVRKENLEPGDDQIAAPQQLRHIGLTAPTRRPPRAVSGELPFDKHPEPTPRPEPVAASAPAQMDQLNLTRSQRAVFLGIASWQTAEGVSPTLAELQKATSLNRFETLNEVDALVRKGLIEFDRSISRGIRIIPEDERIPTPESLNFPAIAPSATTPLPTASPALSDSGIKSEKLPVAEVLTTITSTTSPVEEAQPNSSVPDWMESLLVSELLNRQYASTGRRAPPREQLRDLLLLIINQGKAVHRETVCHTLGLPPIRYEGFIAIIRRLINIDSVQILTRDEAGDMIRLDVDLLCRQFGIER